MKRYVLYFFVFAFSLLWGECTLSISDEDINPRPMLYKNDGNISLTISNLSSRPIPSTTEESPTCRLNIELSLLELKDLNSSRIMATSDLISYFDIVYITSEKRIELIQIADIPEDWSSQITIPVNVAGQSSSEDSLNGFYAYTIKETEEVRLYTYTDSSILLANIDSNSSVYSGVENIVIDNLTLNDTINGKLVILSEDITIASISNDTLLEINQTSGRVTVPSNLPAGLYNAEYTICEVFNTNNCSTGNIEITVYPTPDFRSTLTVYGGIVNGAGIHAFSFDTLVRNIIEDSSYNPSRPLVITIPKNSALTLTFDSSTTSFKGQEVENSLWSFDDSDPFDYIMTYIGSDIPTGRSRFSLEGTLDVDNGEVGKFFLETTIQSGTGGDSNIDNNSDRETLEKRL